VTSQMLKSFLGLKIEEIPKICKRRRRCGHNDPGARARRNGTNNQIKELPDPDTTIIEIVKL